MEEKEQQIAHLQKANEDLRQEIAILKEELQELKNRLNLNSRNSSKPPSSDGLRKRKVVHSLRSKTGKKSGGQKGHKGHTLEMKQEADEIIEHKLRNCRECGRDLNDVASKQVIRRQVFDLPKPKVQVTEHQSECKICPWCKASNKASFPESVKSPVSYGCGVKSWAIYLQHGQLIPEKRLAELFKDVFKLPISAASLASFAIELAPKLEKWMGLESKALAQAPVKHVDETGFRIAGKTSWLHSIGTEKATLYRASKRGDVPENLRGIVVHDHFKSYYSKIKGASHALCNAHHLRELKQLIENKKVKETWAQSMYRLLVLLSKLVKKPVALSVPDRFKKVYESVVARGLAYHQSLPQLAKGKRGRRAKRKGHNLLIRLHDYKQDVLRCLEDDRVPFSNNLAERDLRMMKVKQKISGGFRSRGGAEVFCTIRSLLATARKQGFNHLSTIEHVLAGHSPPIFT